MYVCFLRYLLLKKVPTDRQGCAIPIRVIRAIRGETISAFPRRVFGNRDRSAKDPKSDRA